MRLALKHQIIMAPAAVLCLMTLLLGFLQFTYWDLSVKRQQAKNLKTAFIALAEADMAVQRMHGVIRSLLEREEPDVHSLEQMTNMYQHLETSINRINETKLFGVQSMSLFQQGLADLDPEKGVDLKGFEATISLLGPHIRKQLNILNQRRDDMSALHREDIDELVAETTFVAIVVLGAAILIGIFLSLAFARRILRRVQELSDSAARITAGDFSPPATPDVVRDEIDVLTVSINRMTDQLIRVVAAEKLLEGAEEERRRIAMDIHDQTLADLSAVRRKLEQLRQDAPCGEQAEELESDLQKAMTNLRVVMDNLHPQTLDILGLPAAVESLLDKSCDGGPVEYHFLDDGGVAGLELSRLVQVTLYRIIAEAINNVLRHARASQLEVSIAVRSGDLVVAVEDNGRGFDHSPQLPTSTGGRGLHNIQERARAIGAQVHWRNSRFSSGTRFELVLPITKD
ncbi:MAG: HAMP domain-containing sensor histidine kinase [Gammaproteobacteria bacterium]|nr:HAMP domain-containing sensor histidine kinase [Gammaproteobacteria bacterium]NIR25558.1 HAMP domain-containing sensor histidine kinase [Gammaproteobacteria bacterium]NIY20351.1 HAMP domain-containing protein [Gammaproteobacteria bacterium]